MLSFDYQIVTQIERMQKPKKIIAAEVELRGVSVKMVENQRKRYRLSYLDNAIFQPSKLKIVQVNNPIWKNEI